MTPSPGPLHGLRVLDFGRYIAGPYCAALLGDLGAEVIRIERVQGGEDRFLQPVAAGGDGALYLVCNRGKLGITLDPMSPAGREITKRLIRTADVVVANLPEPALHAMGIDRASVTAEKPDVVLALITAYGTEGPFANRLGFDGVGQAMSGAMYFSGNPDLPVKCAANYVDFTTALAAALGVVAALTERQRTGRGQIVESSLLASAVSALGAVLLEQAVASADRKPTGNRSQFAGPADTFRTLDGWVLVHVIGQAMFERCAELLGKPEWRDDARFSDDSSRGEHGAALSEVMQAWCGERTTAAVLASLAAAKIPASPVHSPRDALADPQLRAAGLFEPVAHPGLEIEAPIPKAPFRLSSGGVAVRGRAPALGEHTDDVLRSLGFGADEIAEFRIKNVV